MCRLWFKKQKKNEFTFCGWCYYAFTVTVSYVITRERWFCMYFLHVTWSCNCLLKIIITYLKPYNCMQTNSYYWIEIITSSYIIIRIRQEYLKPQNYVQITCITLGYLTSFNSEQKKHHYIRYLDWDTWHLLILNKKTSFNCKQKTSQETTKIT